MGTINHVVLLVMFAITLVYALPEKQRERARAIGIFNVVKFPNDACIADSPTMNGTCYTSEECSSRDGVASGSCAEGYGVCCIISISCKGSSSENCTYLSQTASTTPSTDPGSTTSCSYEICPIDSNINRIRFDLTTFQIAGPYMVTAADDLDGTPTVAPQAETSAVGACLDDTFIVSGTSSSPTICGLNTGQHLIVDTDGSTCVNGDFSFGGGTTSRSYSIKVTQYSRFNEMGGPSGCLQFYTGETGTVESFNWQGTAGARATNPGTHLQNQNYKVCVRQMETRCILCWHPTVAGDANAIRGSFGLSVSPQAAAGKSGGGITNCVTDYVIIPGAIDGFTAATLPAAGTAPNGGNVAIDVATGVRYCGRFFNEHDQADSETACTRSTPFTLGVVTDDNEALANVGQGKADVNELAEGAAAMGTIAFGTMGFSLDFAQRSC